MKSVLISSKPLEISEYKTHKEAVFLISVLDEWDLSGRMITKDAGKKYHNTIVGFPIVAKLIKDKKGNPVDFRGHEMKVIIKKDGKKDYRYDTMPIGSVLESWIEKRKITGYEGDKYCIMIKCKLWSDRFPEYFTVLDKLWAENNVSSSWELLPEKWTNTVKGKIIKVFSFVGNAILGSDVEGAVPGAGIYEYAQLNSNNLELASALSNDCSQLKFTEKISGKNKNEQEEKMDNIKTEKEDISAAATKVEKLNDNEKENKKQAALTVKDLRKKIQEEIGKVSPSLNIEFIFPIENYILGKTWKQDENELDFTKVTYSVNEDNSITLGGFEKITLIESVVNLNASILKKNEVLLKANEDILRLEAENKELIPYKERCEKEDTKKKEAEIAERRRALEQYALSSKQVTVDELETEEFKVIINELNEVKLKSIISDRVVDSISKKRDSEQIESAEVETKENPKANIDIVADIKELDAKSIIQSFIRK